jgi:hypothetical protein
MDFTSRRGSLLIQLRLGAPLAVVGLLVTTVESAPGPCPGPLGDPFLTLLVYVF